MGDEDKYTPEELAILGETPEEPPKADPEPPPAEEAAPSDAGKPAEEAAPPAEEKPAEEAKQPEHTEEEQKVAEQMGLRIEQGFIIDDEGTKIPATRWKKLYAQYKEASRTSAEALAGKANLETKFKLFRELGPEKYFSIYPSEAPRDEKRQRTEMPPVQRMDPLDMVAQYPDPGHQFHGMTLREIYQHDAGEARKLERAWEQVNRRAELDAEEAKRRVRRESEEEISSFTRDMAKDLFNKEATAMNADEEKKVAEVVQQTLDFMRKTGRGGGKLPDAYFLMNRDQIIARERDKAGKAALASLNKPSIQSIGTGGRPAAGGMSRYTEMTADQILDALNAMDDKAYQRFLKEAPLELRQKYPSIAWN